jgi:CBS domain-containing protein
MSSSADSLRIARARHPKDDTRPEIARRTGLAVGATVSRLANHIGEATMKARDIMTSDPSVITQREPVSRAAEIMHDLDVGIVPVVDDPSSMCLIGVITDRDIAVRCVAKKHGDSCIVGEHMTCDHLDTVCLDDDVEAVMALMARDQVRRIPVIGNDHRLAGIISQADLATKLGPKEPQKIEEVLQRVSAPHKFAAAT